jgi:hypothetical protein
MTVTELPIAPQERKHLAPQLLACAGAAFCAILDFAGAWKVRTGVNLTPLLCSPRLLAH